MKSTLLLFTGICVIAVSAATYEPRLVQFVATHNSMMKESSTARMMGAGLKMLRGTVPPCVSSMPTYIRDADSVLGA